MCLDLDWIPCEPLCTPELYIAGNRRIICQLRVFYHGGYCILQSLQDMYYLVIEASVVEEPHIALRR